MLPCDGISALNNKKWRELNVSLFPHYMCTQRESGHGATQRGLGRYWTCPHLDLGLQFPHFWERISA